MSPGPIRVDWSSKHGECRDLSDRLNLTRAEGEKWIVNLIRETRMGADAKIDLEKVRCAWSGSDAMD